MVVALVQIHNFCINHNDIVLPVTCLDQLKVKSQVEGHVALMERKHIKAQCIPEQLIRGGNEFQDVAR